MTASAQPPSTANVIRSDAEAIAVAHQLAARVAVRNAEFELSGQRTILPGSLRCKLHLNGIHLPRFRSAV